MLVNTNFIRFRFLQILKLVSDIPVLYLVLIALLLFAAGGLIYSGMNSVTGATLITGVALLGVLYFHLNRTDYHFVCLVEEYPAKVWCMDYIMVFLPLLVFAVWKGHYIVLLLLLGGVVSISLVKSSRRQSKKGFPVPSFVPVKAFEIRSGIRVYGISLLFFYLAAFPVLFVPYVSFFFLWIYVGILSGFYTVSESVSILCSYEQPFFRFLFSKIKRDVSILVVPLLPVCLLYVIIYPLQWWLPIAFLVFSILNFILFILCKYAYYYPERNAGNKIIVSLSLFGFVPVTLLFIIKYYYSARRNLIPYLYAYS